MPTGFESSVVGFSLLSVEVALILLTLALLFMSRREQKARDSLMGHLSTAVDVLTRQEYFLAVYDSLQRADRFVCANITGSPPDPAEEDVVVKIVEAVSRATARGVKVSYLLPHTADRLSMANRYAKANAEVKFNAGVLVSDARFMVVDDKEVVIGLPSKNGPDEPTKKGHAIRSESVAVIFRRDFEEHWNSSDAVGYWAFLKELVDRARDVTPERSPGLIASNLDVDVDHVKKVMESGQTRMEAQPGWPTPR